MPTESVSLAVAFFAGLLSFLSPCVLPLVPSYVTFITGLSLDELGRRRGTALTHALFFIAGFTLIFMALGATATQLGRFLNQYQVWIERVGGLLIAFFGVYLLGVIRFGPLAREARFHFQDKPVGYFGSAIVGLAFGAGWTPCIGPILASILMLNMVEATLGQGTLLLFAYSMGLALPFVIAAVAVETFLDWFQKFRKYIPIVERVAGALLIFVGVLLATGYFSLLAGWLQGLTPQFIRERI
jgi:cytochrome c-type biogenesis protein